MVGDVHLGADSVAEVIVEFGVEDIVDTIRGEDTALVGDARAFAAGAERVFESVGYFEVAIGLRGVVEVAADNDWGSARVDMGAQTPGLLLALLESGGYLFVQLRHLLVQLTILVVVVQNSFAIGIVILIDME